MSRELTEAQRQKIRQNAIHTAHQIGKYMEGALRTIRTNLVNNQEADHPRVVEYNQKLIAAHILAVHVFEGCPQCFTASELRRPQDKDDHDTSLSDIIEPVRDILKEGLETDAFAQDVDWLTLPPQMKKTAVNATQRQLDDQMLRELIYSFVHEDTSDITEFIAKEFPEIGPFLLIITEKAPPYRPVSIASTVFTPHSALQVLSIVLKNEERTFAVVGEPGSQ